MRDGLAEDVAQGLQLAVEGVQLGAAILDTVADFLGEVAEFLVGLTDAAGGDLDVDGEDTQVGEIAPHILYAAGQVGAQRRHPLHRLAAFQVPGRQSHQPGGGGLQFGGGGVHGLCVESRAQLVQRGDQQAEPVHGPAQNVAGLQEPALHGPARAIQPGGDRRGRRRQGGGRLFGPGEGVGCDHGHSGNQPNEPGPVDRKLWLRSPTSAGGCDIMTSTGALRAASRAANRT